MDNLLKKFQQVTDIHNTTDLKDREPSDFTWGDDTPREQLEAMLRLSQHEYNRMKMLYMELKSEAEALQDEHTALRAKAAGLREQAQLTQMATRKTILSLAGVDESDEKKVAYTAMLQSQIASLKESVKASTERAEASEAQLQNVREKYQRELECLGEELERWKGRVQLLGTGQEDGTPDELAQGYTSLEIQRCRREIEEMKERLAIAQQRAALAEGQAEKTATLLQQAENDLHTAVEDFSAKVKKKEDEFKAQLKKTQDTDYAKYARDLEEELRMWRGGKASSEAKTEGSAPLVPTSAVSCEERAKLEEVAQAAEQRASDLESKCDELQKQVDELQHTVTDLRLDAEAREQALEAMYNDEKTLRQEAEGHVQQINALLADIAERDDQITALEESRHQAQQALEEANITNARLQRANNSLQKEMGQRNETLRKSRMELAKAKTAETSPASASPHHPAKPEALSRDAMAHYFSWRRIQVYIAAAFVVVVLLLGFYQTHGITEDTSMSIELKECRRLKAISAGAKG